MKAAYMLEASAIAPIIRLAGNSNSTLDTTTQIQLPIHLSSGFKLLEIEPRKAPRDLSVDYMK
jgi:hypothetical protein